MANTISPNMNLIVPTVGNEIGPIYAFDINNSLALIDQHDHSPGKGVRITPAGININATLNFNDNIASNIVSLSLMSNSSPTSNVDSISAAAISGITELFYTDSNGTSTQITSNGTVNATVASVEGLDYNIIAASSWSFNQAQSSLPTTPANLYVGSLFLQPNVADTTVNTELVPPSSGNYTIDLPVPTAEGYTGVPNFVTMDQSGQQTNTYYLDNITLNASGNAIEVKPGGIGLTQLNASVLGAFTTWNSHTITTTGTFTIPTNVNQLFIVGYGGGAGGGSGGASADNVNDASTAGGSGGSGSIPQLFSVFVTPADILTITIGAGGVGGAAVTSTNQIAPIAGNIGVTGTNSLVTGTGVSLIFGPGQSGGAGGAAIFGAGNVAAAANPATWEAIGSYSSGGAGGSAGTSPTSFGNPGGAGGINSYVSTSSTGGTGGFISGGGHTANFGGGGGGGAGGASGGAGGNGNADSPPTSGATAAANSGGGGGGGGGASYFNGSNATSGAGGAGGSGQVTLYWLGAAS